MMEWREREFETESEVLFTQNSLRLSSEYMANIVGISGLLAFTLHLFKLTIFSRQSHSAITSVCLCLSTANQKEESRRSIGQTGERMSAFFHFLCLAHSLTHFAVAPKTNCTMVHVEANRGPHFQAELEFE